MFDPDYDYSDFDPADFRPEPYLPPFGDDEADDAEGLAVADDYGPEDITGVPDHAPGIYYVVVDNHGEGDEGADYLVVEVLVGGPARTVGHYDERTEAEADAARWMSVAA